MAAITAAVIAIAGVVLGWIAIEIACKPCLEQGREAIDRSLNPDHDPDDGILRAPLHPDPDPASRSVSKSQTEPVSNVDSVLATPSTV